MISFQAITNTSLKSRVGVSTTISNERIRPVLSDPEFLTLRSVELDSLDAILECHKSVAEAKIASPQEYDTQMSHRLPSRFPRVDSCELLRRPNIKTSLRRVVKLPDAPSNNLPALVADKKSFSF